MVSTNHVNSTNDVDLIVVEERESEVLEWESHLVAVRSRAEVLEADDVDFVVVEERESKVLESNVEGWIDSTVELVNVKSISVVEVVNLTIGVKLSEVSVSEVLETNNVNGVSVKEFESKVLEEVHLVAGRSRAGHLVLSF